MAKRQGQEQGPNGPAAGQSPPVLNILIEFDQQSGQVSCRGNILQNKIITAGMLQMALQLVLGERPPQRDVGLQIVHGALSPPGGRAN